MSNQHANEAAGRLRMLREGRGGRVAVVLAEPGHDAAFPAGLRRPPASTALEAVLSYMADEHESDGRGGPYRRIVVFSGMNQARPGPHLPDVFAGSGLRVGYVPGVWEFRSLPTTTPAPTAPPARRSGVGKLMAGVITVIEETREEIRQEEPPGVVLATYQGEKDWLQQTAKVLKLIDEAIGRRWDGDGYKPENPPTHRTLLILDDDLLFPRTDQIRSVEGGMDPRHRAQLEDRLNSLPEAVRGTPVDLVLLCRSAETVASLGEGGMLHDQFLRITHAGRTQPNGSWFPRMHWRADAPNLVRATLERLDPSAPFNPHLPSDPRGRTLYDALRLVPPRIPPKAGVRRAADPRNLDLAFWADIDVEGLEAELKSKVIGQRHVLNAIVRSFRDFRERCRDALASGRTTLPARPEYRPPVFLFMGESGMGKTHVARVIADHLFGGSHFELIKLTQRSAADTLAGSRMGYVGYDQRPLFLEYCDRTGGMGLVLFDELDKVDRHNSPDRLDMAVSPFLGPLEDWNLIPNNPGFANAEGRAHFANTVVLFTANVLGDGGGYRPGYERLSQFGDPFLSRVSSRNRLSFGAIESVDVRPAVAHFLDAYCRGLLEQIFQEGSIEIDPNLIESLSAEFDGVTAGRTEIRNYRALKDDFLPTRLSEEVLKSKFRAGGRRVAIGDLDGQWRPERRS